MAHLEALTSSTMGLVVVEPMSHITRSAPPAFVMYRSRAASELAGASSKAQTFMPGFLSTSLMANFLARDISGSCRLLMKTNSGFSLGLIGPAVVFLRFSHRLKSMFRRSW